MFEKSKPISRTVDADNSGNDQSVESGNAAHAERRAEGDALRRIEWSELTARLNAARDLRAVLRSDAASDRRDNAANYAEVAARYLRSSAEPGTCDDNDERDVNPVALEHRKGSPGMLKDTNGVKEDSSFSEVRDQGHTATGDARDNR